MGFRSGLPQPNSSIYLIPLWLDTLKRPSCVPGAACRSGTIATPPKSGGSCGPKKRCAVAHPFSALMTGRYRPHLSLREGLEQPPRSGAEKPRFSNPFYSRAPFPLALDDPGSVLAVKGSLRRFAPWTAPGRSERRAVHEGKGGERAVGREGESLVLAHDKGYYHSYCGRTPKGNLSALPAALSRSRGALSPAGP